MAERDTGHGVGHAVAAGVNRTEYLLNSSEL